MPAAEIESTEKTGWVLIPPTILAIKDLTLVDKVVLGRINGLISTKGYCYASNDYLASGLGVSTRTVQNSISRLISKKLLKRSLQVHPQTGASIRWLFILLHSHDTGGEDIAPPHEDFAPPHEDSSPIDLIKNLKRKEHTRKGKTKADEIAKEYRAWLETFNQEYQTNFKTNALLGNFQHWRGSYSQEEMLKAIPKIGQHEWLSDKLKPELVLRQRDTHGNPVDRIGELLSLKPARRFV